MTGSEAFDILIKNSYRTSLVRCRSCLDFGTFYLFCVAPMDVKDSDDYLTGTIYECVDKKTGRIFEYDITSDIDAYDRAKEIKIDTIFDKKVGELS